MDTTLIIDNGFNTIFCPVRGDSVLDAALDAWADAENNGCILSVETIDGEPGWFFNPDQHARFVHGPVEPSYIA